MLFRSKANAVGGEGISGAVTIVTAPSTGTTAIVGTSTSTAWFLDRGQFLSIQLLKSNADNLVPTSISIWATRRGDAG